jgi:putative tryptophan/tyrosine transport system substrate-binding protein
MSYGQTATDVYACVATYVDKILRGANPANLPVEHPRAFELVINQKTANALGLAIPRDILLRANDVLD